MAGGWTTLLHVFICFFLRNNVLDVEPIYTFRGHRWVLRNLSLIFLTFQGVKLRLIQAPMRPNFSLWRPNPES